MLHAVVDRRNKIILRTEDHGYAMHYAKHIGGTVRSDIIKNPSAKVQHQSGSEIERKNLFQQYASTPSQVWARETIQNSVDNKATKIIYSVNDITTGPLAGCCLARIVDNGTGMDLKTLQDKFLTFGGTGKGGRDEETDTIGGFGEAKKVILFAWRAWRIITKRADSEKAILADSPNGWEDYDWNYITPPKDIQISGTIVEVICWKEYQFKISTPDAENFISYCDLPNIKFSVRNMYVVEGSLLSGKTDYSENREKSIYPAENGSDSISSYGGESIKIKSGGFINGTAGFTMGRSKATFNALVETKNGLEEKQCAKLYYKKFDKSDKSSTPRIFFRVKGLYLWSNWMPKDVRGDIIIDFTIKTTLILTDNRDAIKNLELHNAIDAWIKDLIKDVNQKLREKSAVSTYVYQGSGESLSAPTKPTAIAAAQNLAIAQMSSGGTRIRAIEKIAEDATSNIISIAAANPTQSPLKISSEVLKELIVYEAKTETDPTLLQNAIERAMFVPEYVLHVEEDLASEGFRIPEKFKPENLTNEAKRILAVWAEMIRLSFMMKGSELTYAVGFVFSEDCLGLFAPKEFFGNYGGKLGLAADGAILINPYYFDRQGRKNLIDVTKSEHIEAMWSTCVHEITHMIDKCGYHDEAFACCLTRNIAYVARVYPLVEIISKIVQTSEPLARARFAKGLDVEEYLSKDTKRGRKPRSLREKQLERFAVEMATVLASSGTMPPKPEEFELDIPDDLWQAVTLAAQSASSSKTAGGLQTDLLIKSLRNRLAASEEKTKLLEQAKPINEPAIVSRSARKPLFRKYN